MYILRCEKNKYYLGATTRSNLRKELEAHRKGKTKWTKRYKALKLIKLVQISHMDEVTEHTIEWMNVKGIHRVRGGEFERFRLSQEDIERIKEERCEGPYSTVTVSTKDNRPTPGMTWHYIPH